MADVSVPLTNWGNLVSEIPQNIANVQNTNANTGLLGAQTQGLNIANQRAAIGLALYKHVLGDFTGQQIQGAPDEGSASGADESDESGDTGSDTAPSAASSPASAVSGSAGSASGSARPPLKGAAATPAAAMAATAGDQAGTAPSTGEDADEGDDEVDSELSPQLGVDMRRAFFVNPAGNPRSQQMLLEGAMSGDPGLLSYAKEQRDLQVQNDTAIAQKRANEDYDLMDSVATSPHALTMLDRINPALAEKIQAKYSKDPETADAVARAVATDYAGMLHQYTGRALVAGKDGVYRDSVTGMQVPVPVQGMSPKDYANMSAKGEALVSVPNSDGTSSQMPLWKADKAPNLASWVAQQAARGGAQTSIANSPLGRVPALPPSVAHPAMARLAAAQRTQQPNGAASAQPNQPTAPQVSQDQAAYNRQMQTALGDQEYRMQQPKVVAGQTQSPAALAQVQQTVKSRAQLMQDAQSATQTASTSLTYLTAARAVLQGKGKTMMQTGAYAGIASAISRLYGGVTATNYQEIAKYLSNAALQTARQSYGARMTQSEVQLQLHDMSPNATQTDQTLSDLVNHNIRQAQYTLASARRVNSYLRAGNDPQSFAEWNQQYFPQQKIVNQQPTQQPAAPSNASGSPAPAASGGKADSGGFVPGQMYRDKNGNTARYIGGGKWQ